MPEQASSKPFFVVLDNDLKANQPALTKAARLARQAGASLRLFVNAWSAALTRSIGHDEQALAKTRDGVLAAWQQRIDELLQAESLASDTVQSTVVWEKDQEDALRKAIMASRPALVATRGEEGGGRLRRLFLTPRDWLLLRNAPCPVLCVDDTPWPDSMPVLAAIDPLHDDDKLEGLNGAILKEAKAMATALSGGLKLAHVLEHPDETLILIAGEAIPSYLGDAETQRKYYREQMRKLSEQADLDPEQNVLLEGLAAPALAEYQHQQGPLLLVLGTVARGAVGRLLLGSTAEQIIANAGGELLAVKAPDFESPWEQIT